MSNRISKSTSFRIFDLLVKHVDADENDRRSFQNHLSEETFGSYEFCSQGSLGFGGKFWRQRHTFSGCPWYVNCNLENLTPENNRAMAKCNEELKKLWDELYFAKPEPSLLDNTEGVGK